MEVIRWISFKTLALVKILFEGTFALFFFMLFQCNSLFGERGENWLLDVTAIE